jgi:cytochrome c oxidase subunit I
MERAVVAAVWQARRDDPWEGNSLEWATSSPPPHHNFHQIPQIRSERSAFDLCHSREHASLDLTASDEA